MLKAAWVSGALVGSGVTSIVDRAVGHSDTAFMVALLLCVAFVALTMNCRDNWMDERDKREEAERQARLSGEWLLEKETRVEELECALATVADAVRDVGSRGAK